MVTRVGGPVSHSKRKPSGAHPNSLFTGDFLSSPEDRSLAFAHPLHIRQPRSIESYADLRLPFLPPLCGCQRPCRFSFFLRIQRRGSVCGIFLFRLPQFRGPDPCFRLEANQSSLVALVRADMSNPNDAETSFAVPAALHFDRGTGLDQKPHRVQPRPELADVHSVSSLDKRIRVCAANDDANGLGNPGIATRAKPEVGRGVLEGKADPK